MKGFAVLLMILPLVFADEIQTESEFVSQEENSVYETTPTPDTLPGDLDPATKDRLYEGLKETIDVKDDEDLDRILTPFGERPVFHCTYLNNMPGRTVCCSFISNRLLQCYSPMMQNLMLPWTYMGRVPMAGMVGMNPMAGIGGLGLGGLGGVAGMGGMPVVPGVGGMM